MSHAQWKKHVNASLRGLGAALVQDGKPVAFASKALTPTEQRYANIKQELLAIVFGVERFPHLCLWTHLHCLHRPQGTWADSKEDPGRCTSVPSMDAPVTPRIWLYHHVPPWRKEMLLADTLSRYAPAQLQWDRTGCHNSSCAHWGHTQGLITGTHQDRPTSEIPCWDYHRWLAWWS